MIPKYEIFVSLLTGMWMPWLENNRHPERFSHLLHATDTGSVKSCSNFFNMLARQSGLSRSPAAQRFMQENNHVADAYAHAADKMENAFFRLPASTSRDQFYNQLTGYCFTGYDQWAKSLLSGMRGEEMPRWYRMRMAGTLLDLVNNPFTFHMAEHPERVIACRALAALCILLHRLTVSPGSQPGDIIPLFSIRDTLQVALADFTLKAPARLEIMELFDALTTEKKAPAPAPVVHTSVQPFTQQAPAAPPADEAPVLTTMYNEWKLNLDSLVQVVSQLANPVPGEKKQQDNPQQLLDSATVKKLLNISSTSLQRYRDRGRLPFTNIGGKYCYWEKDVMNLIEEGKNQKRHNTGKNRPVQPEY